MRERGRREPGHVVIRPWVDGDLELLRRLLGEPEMMRYLGGPESPEAMEARHRRYLTADPETNGLFAVTAGDGAEPVGWAGFWESEWRGETVWECGWHVVPEAQGRGIATAATALLLEEARRRGRHREVHAFPSVGNAASNALCRTLGFRCLGEVEVEYPKGHLMRSNDWRYELWPSYDPSEEAPAEILGGRPGRNAPTKETP
jgi:RimJ/RimL family protein N-acetyltransferase